MVVGAGLPARSTTSTGRDGGVHDRLVRLAEDQRVDRLDQDRPHPAGHAVDLGVLAVQTGERDLGYVPVPGVQMNVLSGVTLRTRSSKVTVTGSPIVPGSANEADGGVVSGARDQDRVERTAYVPVEVDPALDAGDGAARSCTARTSSRCRSSPPRAVEGRDAPVRDPQDRVAGRGDRGRVAGSGLPPVRARVDDRANPQALGHTSEPPEDPLGHLGLREPAGALDVEDREQVVGAEQRVVDEVVGLADRVVRAVVRLREVIGAEPQSRRLGARLVDRVHRVDERAALGGLREHELLPGGRDGRPVDQVLMVGDVDPRDRARGRERDVDRLDPRRARRAGRAGPAAAAAASGRGDEQGERDGKAAGDPADSCGGADGRLPPRGSGRPTVPDARENVDPTYRRRSRAVAPKGDA